MQWFYNKLIENKLIGVVITFSLIALGIKELQSIERDRYPRVDFGQIIISTEYPGASADEVELRITNKLEDALREVVGIDRYQSWSSENLSRIRLDLNPDTRDYDSTIEQVRDAINRVNDLPSELDESPQIEIVDTSIFPIMEIAITGHVSYRELRSAARQVERVLETIKGVGRIERYGYRAREIVIGVQPELTKKYMISLNQISEAIKKRNIFTTNGSMESYIDKKTIVTLSQFSDPMEVKDVIVKKSFDGPYIRIKDLAVVKDDFEKEQVISRANGDLAITLRVFKQPESDIVRTSKIIKDALTKDKKMLFDTSSIELNYVNDLAVYVEHRLSIVLTNGLMGLFLVFIILFLFLKFKFAFWTALGVPVVLLGTIFILPHFGGILDTVTLTSLILVIGIIVDDAIIISESIYSKLEAGVPGYSAAIDGVTEVIKPVITTIFTTFAAFMPLFYLNGLVGKFVFYVPLVVAIALVVSLIESTVALPAHLSRNVNSHGKLVVSRWKKNVFHLAKNIVRWITLISLKIRYLILILLFGGLVFIGFNEIKYAKFEMFPNTVSEKFSIYLVMPIGTSLKATNNKAIEVEKLIKKYFKEDVASFVTRVGMKGNVITSIRENYASIHVYLKPFSQRELTSQQIADSLRGEITKLEGVSEVIFNIDNGGVPVGKAISLHVVGNDDQLRETLANKMFAYLKKHKGVIELNRSDKTGKKQLSVRLNYERLAMLGVSVSDVAQSIRIAYDGEKVTSVRYGDEDVVFRVIMDQEFRKSENFLQDLQIQNGAGLLTPLSQFAEFEENNSHDLFEHYKGERSVTITGNIDRQITTALEVAEDIRNIFKDYDGYPDVRYVIEGEAKESQNSIYDLSVIFGISLLCVYIFIALLFNSLWQPLIVMSLVPFAVVAVIYLYIMANKPIGLLAVTGMIGLVGVVVNGALVLINRINTLVKSNPDVKISKIIAQATADRMRAILLTTMTTVAGLIPLVHGVVGTDPYLSPMAFSLGYGLLITSPLTFILISCLYNIGYDIKYLFSR